MDDLPTVHFIHLQLDFQCPLLSFTSILLFIKKEILLTGIVGPDIFDAFINIALIFHFLQLLSDFRLDAKSNVQYISPKY